MLTRCFRHQYPECYGRPTIEPATYREIYGREAANEAVANQGAVLPPGDPGVEGYVALGSAADPSASGGPA